MEHVREVRVVRARIGVARVRAIAVQAADPIAARATDQAVVLVTDRQAVSSDQVHAYSCA